MDILPIIETRRAKPSPKRRNGAAYQHRRRRSLTAGHAAITHGRRIEYPRSHSMFLTHSIARLTATSWSDRASLPRKRARSAHAQLFAHRLRSPTWSHVCAGPLNSYILFPDSWSPLRSLLIIYFYILYFLLNTVKFILNSPQFPKKSARKRK